MRQFGRRLPNAGLRCRVSTRSIFAAVLPLALCTLSSALVPAQAIAKPPARHHAAKNDVNANDAAAVEFFEKRVRPLLVANCYTCHSADTNSRGGLRVDDRNGLLTGGSRGPAVIPFKPDESLLIKAVTRVGELKMPPERPLAAADVAILKQWIRDGAAWTRVEAVASDRQIVADYAKLRKEHWAWQPLRDPKVPVVSDADWPRDPIDRFLLARMTERGLKPVPDADKRTLIRRATFDLTGLPPTLAEIDAFVADQSDTAFERLVDRLLASPAFGERWGRHWLDVARYGESTGSARNLPYPHAWRYRDYVINALNADKPYDEFLREQIAGDLLPGKTAAERAEHLIATGFLAVGVKDVNQRFKVRFVMDNIDEQIDTVTRSTLALTASCARCHDHKFDPIPTADYYALAGIFQSSDLCAALRNQMGGGNLDYYEPRLLLPLAPRTGAAPPSSEQIRSLRRDLGRARDELDAAKAAKDPAKLARARQKVKKLQAQIARVTDPAGYGPVAQGARDAAIVADAAIRIRGEAEKHGAVVPRGFLSVVHFAGQPTIAPGHSGRLELAQWLTSPQNPLVSRVIVNRVWHHLFGSGLVKTVDNFGINGDVPSHLELLDHLANRLIRDGWSLKKLVRSIMLTRAYRLSASAPAEPESIDPDNRLVWRHSPRRLDAEEIRDATLAVAGQLDLSRPVGSPAMQLPVIELANNGPPAQRMAAAAAASRHRSVYLPLLRGLTPNSLAAFDFAEQGMVTGARDTTTVAPQALYLLNDPFVRTESQALAAQLLAATQLSDAERIDRAYRLVFGRPARGTETARAADYLADYTVAVNDAQAAPRTAKVAGKTSPSKTAPVKTNQSKNARPAIRKVSQTVVRSSKSTTGPRPQLSVEQSHVEQSNVGQTTASSADPRTVAWQSFCQALLSAAEFRYVR
jgi:cytochrome c553